MKVSLARRSDLPAVAAIGTAAMREAYRALLRSATIEALIDVGYSPASLERRWEDHPMLIARDAGEPIGFADAILEPDRIVIAAIHTAPGHRRRGAGSLLVQRAREMAELPATVDLLLGNTQAERFFEHRGFVPGETIEVSFFGEPVVERRWYLPAHSPLPRAEPVSR